MKTIDETLRYLDYAFPEVTIRDCYSPYFIVDKAPFSDMVTINGRLTDMTFDDLLHEIAVVELDVDFLNEDAIIYVDIDGEYEFIDEEE